MKWPKRNNPLLSSPTKTDQGVLELVASIESNKGWQSRSLPKIRSGEEYENGKQKVPGYGSLVG